MVDERRKKSDSTRVIPEGQLPRGRALEPAEEVRANLVVLSGWDIGRQFELHEGENVLGRALGCAITVDSSSVSRRHARILQTRQGDSAGFVVKDLGSTNGTLVNEAPIQTAHLNDGDIVQLGDVVFKLVVYDTIEADYHREIRRKIQYDHLTGLMRMEPFRRCLDAEIRRGHEAAPFTIAMTDLDGLKQINDERGHLAGSMVVGEMGDIIRQLVRSADRAALYGGDETILLFPKTSIEEAAKLAERLRSMIEQRTLIYETHTLSVTISQGLAEWPRHGETSLELIAAADKALYQAKTDGRNCVRLAEK